MNSSTTKAYTRGETAPTHVPHNFLSWVELSTSKLNSTYLEYVSENYLQFHSHKPDTHFVQNDYHAFQPSISIYLHPLEVGEEYSE